MVCTNCGKDNDDDANFCDNCGSPLTGGDNSLNDTIVDEKRVYMEYSGKQRHGCITSWLVFLIVINAIVGVVYIFQNEYIIDNMSPLFTKEILLVIGFLSLANMVFAVLLLKWKKIGFYGFVVTSGIVFGINLYLEIGLFQSIFGLSGILILFAIL